jgi:hypothetical protein
LTGYEGVVIGGIDVVCEVSWALGEGGSRASDPFLAIDLLLWWAEIAFLLVRDLRAILPRC